VSTLKKILIVDDEANIQNVAKVALEIIGRYEVQTSASGLEALERIKTFVPDLILLNVNMPEMDGRSTLKKIRDQEAFSKMPIVFVTANFQPHEIKAFMELGATDVIGKPFDPKTFTSRIEAIWDKHKANT
jgi:CheY-like chemotaxis protein